MSEARFRTIVADDRRRYEIDGFEVLALVALDIREIAYIRWEGQQHVQIPAPGTEPRPGGHGAIRRNSRSFEASTFFESAL